MSPPRKVVIIYNPTSGSRKYAQVEETIQHLVALGCQVTVHGTQHPGHARQLAAEACKEGIDVLAVAGGDGTISEAVQGMDPVVTLAIIPTGTANVLAVELGIYKLGPKRWAKIIAKSKPERFYLSEANDQKFMMFCSVGPDADAVAHVDLKQKKRWGKGAYANAFLKAAFRYSAPKLRVTLDGDKAYEANAVIVTKTRYYAGSFIIAPDADFRGKGFEVILIKGMRWSLPLKFLCAVGLSRIKRLFGIQTERAKTIEIKSMAGFECNAQIDGDPAGTIPLKIRSGDQIYYLLSSRNT